MRTLLVIGTGMGGPDALTGAAAAALARADVVFAWDKGAVMADLRTARLEVCARFAPHARLVDLPEVVRDRHPERYADEVARWLGERAAVWEAALAELPEDATAAYLPYGDPALYDSTLRILATLPVDVEVYPGLTSIQLLTAAHKIPLNEIGRNVLITTGRRLAEDAAGHDTLVVMLDGGTAWTALEGDWDVWWGAYLGLPDAELRSGSLSELSGDLAELKQALRERKGWVMDVYLLRRRST